MNSTTAVLATLTLKALFGLLLATLSIVSIDTLFNTDIGVSVPTVLSMFCIMLTISYSIKD